MKTRINVLLVFCLLFNGFSPRSFLLSSQDDVLQLLENQPFTGCYNSLTTVPVKIVSALFVELYSVAGKPGKNKPVPPAKKIPNTSADYSFLAEGKRGQGNKCWSENRKPDNFPGHSKMPGHSLTLTAAGEKVVRPNDPVVGWLLLLLLLLFTLLARGDLDGIARIMLYFSPENRSGCHPTGFFIGATTL